MKLIVGLGNPGTAYETTRHNAGFLFIDAFAAQYWQTTIQKKKFNGLYEKVKYHNQDIILLKPQEYMNLSGHCVQKFMHFFKIKLEDLMIIHDELDLPFGKYQFKIGGRDAGHNGIKNIIQILKTQDFCRLRIGIGRSTVMKTADWVLTAFSVGEQQQLTTNNAAQFEPLLKIIQS